jgi:hypothetical protein
MSGRTIQVAHGSEKLALGTLANPAALIDALAK